MEISFKYVACEPLAEGCDRFTIPLTASDAKEAIEQARIQGWEKGLRCTKCKKPAEVIKTTITTEIIS